MTQKEDAEREALLDDHIELNLSNYNEDDVATLNYWAIRAYDFIAALDASAEPVNQCDGCRVNAPLSAMGNHVMPDGGFMGCTADRYPAASKHQGAESGRAVARGVQELLNVVLCLREMGQYTDEEGEATDALDDLYQALAAQPQQPDSEAPEKSLQSLLDDVTAIDTWYRGSPSYEHDAGWFKDRVVRLIEQRIEESK